ncbi:MAG: metallophosphoesterase family protein [Verrucomicrobiota bacterium]
MVTRYFSIFHFAIAAVVSGGVISEAATNPPAPVKIPKVTRGPYLQSGTPHSVVVRWRTDEMTKSMLRYGIDPLQLTNTAQSAGVLSEHVVLVRNLKPQTKYFYSIGTDKLTLSTGPDHFFVTSPLPGTAQPTRIWVIGDAGTRGAKQRAVRYAYEQFAGDRHTDLWLMLGDNAYPDGTDEQYQGAVFDMYRDLLRKSVVWPTVGNHDAISATSDTQSGVYFDLFTLPTLGQAGGLPSGTEAYYAFDFANIHFICLDSHDTDRSPNGAMLTWLKHDLASTRQHWIFAFWHHPVYSKGSHDSDNDNDSGARMRDMRTNALPILEAAGVDLVLNGHSHNYERSFLLDGHYGRSETLKPEMKKNAGDGRPDGQGAYAKVTLGPGVHEGAVYVVAGSSGQASGGTLDHPAMFISLNELGSLILDVNSNRLDAVFLDYKGSRRDYFTIIKGQ